MNVEPKVQPAAAVLRIPSIRDKFCEFETHQSFCRRLRLPAGKGKSLTSGERIFYNADYQFNRDRLYIIFAYRSGGGRWGQHNCPEN